MTGPNETECRAEMGELGESIERVRNYQTIVDAITGPDVISGKAGDELREDWDERAKKLRNLADDAEAQIPDLIAGARDRDEALQEDAEHS
ncbi:hypothetical protein [Phytoactinopolyspora mesophila]|uniref:Uncharacterized protein n=1 Tax=Phytoactinopolyspora mesophila TaxID=2650750 RepID=A0A7K3M567_9ACTN|nr:hypothetical protein [Phytoactinopolyspora mesophila]NDL58453.1 hypothetical protein [Phytoactinopolyspora mesophila]